MTKRRPDSTRKIRSDKGKSRYPTSGAALVEWINGLHTHQQIKQFYMSSAWKKVKEQALRRDHYECQRCKKKGIAEPATVVHHKKYLRDRPDLALTLDNLECLCSECHYREHHPDYAKYIDQYGHKKTDGEKHKASQWRWYSQYYQPPKTGKIKAKHREEWNDDPFSDDKKDDPL